MHNKVVVADALLGQGKLQRESPFQGRHWTMKRHHEQSFFLLTLLYQHTPVMSGLTPSHRQWDLNT